MYSNIGRVLMFRQPLSALSPHPYKRTIEDALQNDFTVGWWVPWAFPTSYACRQEPEAPVLTVGELKHLGSLKTFQITQTALLDRFFGYLSQSDDWVYKEDAARTRRAITRMLDHVRETRGVTISRAAGETFRDILVAKVLKAGKAFQFPLSTAHWFAASSGVELSEAKTYIEGGLFAAGHGVDWRNDKVIAVGRFR